VDNRGAIVADDGKGSAPHAPLPPPAATPSFGVRTCRETSRPNELPPDTSELCDNRQPERISPVENL